MDKGEVSIKHCPSIYMLADYFTKPLQGRIFRAFRQVIMGYKSISWLKTELSLNKERVEKTNKLNLYRENSSKEEVSGKERKPTYAEVTKGKVKEMKSSKIELIKLR